MTHPLRSAALLVLLAGPALAAPPAVVADTAPVASLVALAMGDLGTPHVLVPPGTSPHEAALRPSDAGALAAADLVIWTGPELLPWMAEAVAALAPEAQSVPLLESQGWTPMPARHGAHLAEAHEEEHGHEEGGIDPHAWLDPAVAAAWVGTIAAALAEADPENAAAYRANAAAAADRLAALGQDARARLSPLAGTGYAVGHDAYQYLERAAGLPASWSVRPADGASPAPDDLGALREAVVAGEVACLVLDAETGEDWARTLGEGTTLRTVTVDPDGVTLPPGPDLYPLVIEGLVAALEECLGG